MRMMESSKDPQPLPPVRLDDCILNEILAKALCFRAVTPISCARRLEGLHKQGAGSCGLFSDHLVIPTRSLSLTEYFSNNVGGR